MRKITFLAVTLVFNVVLGKTPPKPTMVNDTVVVEILDETWGDGTLLIDANFQEPTVLVYSNLKSINSSLEIIGTSNLVSIKFPNLKLIEDVIQISENDHLNKVSFDNLELIGGYAVIHDNAKLGAIRLNSLEYIDGYFEFHNNQGLTEIFAPNIKKICGEISFRFNQALKNINFPSLVSVGGCNDNPNWNMFDVSNNYNLLEFHLPKLEYVGDLRIHDNESLFKMEALNLKEAVTVEINHNPVLQQLNIQSLIYAGTSFHIYDNPELKFLNLGNLTKVDAELHIMGNIKLEYLNLCSYPTPDIQFHENGEPVVDNPSFIVFNDTPVDQPPFCPDQKPEEEVEGEESEDDPTVVDEPTRVSLHPNPAEDIVQIDSEIAFDKVELYDLSGNLIKSFRPSESGYDVSDIAAGMYIMIICHRDSSYGSVQKLAIR